MALVFASNSHDFQPPAKSQEQKAPSSSTFLRISNFSRNLFNKLALPDANPLLAALWHFRSSHPSSSSRQSTTNGSHRWDDFSDHEVGLKIAVSVTSGDLLAQSKGGSLVQRACIMKVSTLSTTISLMESVDPKQSDPVAVFGIRDDTIELNQIPDSRMRSPDSLFRPMASPETIRKFSSQSVNRSTWKRSPTVRGKSLVSHVHTESGEQVVSRNRMINHSPTIRAKISQSHEEARQWKRNLMMNPSPAIEGDMLVSRYDFERDLSFHHMPADTSTRHYMDIDDLKEMRLMEGYTCITSHGPPLKRIHIFNDQIYECQTTKPYSFEVDRSNRNGATVYPSCEFLRYCYSCEKELDHNMDIYIYRGEQAFCSEECRGQEIFLEGMMSQFHCNSSGSLRAS